MHHWPLNREKEGVARARLFFRRYGFLSIFIGRFLGPVRPTIPLVAGIMRMRHITFQIANVTSSLAWVPFMLLPGYFFARSVGNFGSLSITQWLFVFGFILLLTALFTLAGVKMHGKSNKQRKNDKQRRQQRRQGDARGGCGVAECEIRAMHGVTIDTRGLSCPLPVLKVRKAMRSIEPGTPVQVLATDALAEQDFRAYCEASDCEFLSAAEIGGGVLSIVIQKGGNPAPAGQ